MVAWKATFSKHYENEFELKMFYEPKRAWS